MVEIIWLQQKTDSSFQMTKFISIDIILFWCVYLVDIYVYVQLTTCITANGKFAQIWISLVGD